MPYADPDVAAAKRAEWEARNPGWRRRYRDDRRRDRGVSRYVVLDEDLAQQRELARLEARHVGRKVAERRLAEWLAAERRWLQRTYRRVEGDDDRDL